MHYTTIPFVLVLAPVVFGQTRKQFRELHASFGNASATWAVVTGDLDNDGDLDLVFGNIAYYDFARLRTVKGRNRLFLNDGTGRFYEDPTALPHHDLGTQDIGLADFDMDGDLDIIIANSGDQANPRQSPNNLYLNNAKGQFVDATNNLPKHNDNTESVAIGDVDGDGDLDVVCGNLGQNRLYLNNGKAVFSDATATRLPRTNGQTTALALLDVDNDKDLDLFVANSSGQNKLLINHGPGVFRDATSTLLPKDHDTSFSVACGDVDHDGDIDLVIGNASIFNAANKLYLNNGKGRFAQAAMRLPNDNDWTMDLLLVDIDLDRDLDLITTDVKGPTADTRLYVNDGNGSFSLADRLPREDNPAQQAVAGDFDLDGDPDLVLANGFFAAYKNRYYANLHRHIDAPAVAYVGKSFAYRGYSRPGYARSVQGLVPYASLGELPRRLQIHPFGLWGLTLNTLLQLPFIVIPAPGGRSADQKATVPRSRSLVGRRLVFQAVALHAPSAATWRFTNLVRVLLR